MIDAAHSRAALTSWGRRRTPIGRKRSTHAPGTTSTTSARSCALVNPNDEIRRHILRYFCDPNTSVSATSRTGKKGSAVKRFRPGRSPQSGDSFLPNQAIPSTMAWEGLRDSAPSASIDPERLTCGVRVLTVFPPPPRGTSAASSHSLTEVSVTGTPGTLGQPHRPGSSEGLWASPALAESRPQTPLAASSRAWTSIFCIVSMAAIARPARSGSGSLNNSPIR